MSKHILDKHILTEEQARRIGNVYFVGREALVVMFSEDELAPDCKGKRIAKEVYLDGDLIREILELDD